MHDATDWQQRVDAVWAAAEELGDEEVIRRIDALAAELPDDDPRGWFERGGALDSAGLEAEAEAFYRRALELGLDGLGAYAAELATGADDRPDGAASA